ncbi:hypothetical protein D3C84_913630 [compost metagenome]
MFEQARQAFADLFAGARQVARALGQAADAQSGVTDVAGDLERVAPLEFAAPGRDPAEAGGRNLFDDGFQWLAVAKRGGIDGAARELPGKRLASHGDLRWVRRLSGAALGVRRGCRTGRGMPSCERRRAPVQ